LPPEFQKVMQEAFARVDWQGFDKKKVEAAIAEALASLDSVKLHFVENCVGCAACAPACPYYVAGEEYGPVEKAEHVRHMYRKKATILGMLLGPLKNAKTPKKPEDLDKLVELVYRCTNCGACYLSCPFGIDSGALIKGVLSSIVTKAGRVPVLMSVFEMVERKKLFLHVPALMQMWDETLRKASEAIGRPLPFDKKDAEYYLFVNLADVMFYPGAVIGAIRILDRAGLDWALPSKPLAFRPPIAAVIGLSKLAKEEMEMVVGEIEKLNPKKVVVLDGGFVYPWMRWQVPKVLGRRPSFKVLHITELVAELLKQGKIKFKKTSDKVTWHDPCQLARRGGVTEEPMEVLRAVSSEFRPLPHHGAESYCCGGGGGIGCLSMKMIEMMAQIMGVPAQMFLSGEKERQFIEKTEQAWALAVRRKIDDIKKSGAEIVTTACPVCMHSIEGGAQLYGLKVKVMHIAEYIADKLE